MTLTDLLIIIAIVVAMAAVGMAVMWPIAVLYERVQWYKRIYGEPKFEYDGCEEDD